MTYSTAVFVANELTNMFPKTATSPVYSLGFTRMMKLTKKQRLNAFTALYFEGFTEIPSNNDEFKKRLADMTEAEFETFRKTK